MKNLFEHFLSVASASPDRVAVIVRGPGEPEKYTYAELRRISAAVAADLRRRQIERGARCAILASNHARWCAVFLGILEHGAVAVPLDTAFNSKQIATLLRDSDARLVFTSQEHLAAIRCALESGTNPCEIVLLEGEAAGYTTLDEILSQAPPTPAAPAPAAADDTAAILYTSGTTSDPKGVELTQANLVAEMQAVFEIVQVTAEDRLLGVLPLFHALALLANCLLPFSVGASVVFLQTISSSEILRAMREHGITIFCCVPQFFYLVHQRILEQVKSQGHLKRLAFRALLATNGFLRDALGVNLGRMFFGRIHEALGPRLRLLVTGGSRFDEEIGRDFHRLGFTLLQAYGLTECTGAATVTPPYANRIGSVGRALPGVEIKLAPARLANEDGRAAGEILIRGPIVMRGYHNRPEATVEALADGYLHSGDLGYLDAEGNLYVTGRQKEVIVLSSGKNIYPEEIEAHYLQSPFIKELCVLGRSSRPGEPFSERLHAIVVPNLEAMRERKIVNMKEILRYEIEGLSIKLPPHKRILTYAIWQDDLPRTTTRKLKRFEIERAITQAAGREELRATPRALSEEEQRWVAEPAVARVLAVMARRAKHDGAIHPDDNLELDLGLDSMERVELLVTLEQEFATQVSDDVATKIYTVRELVAAILGESAGTGRARAARPAWEVLLAPEPVEDFDLQEILKPKRLLAAACYVVLRFFYLAARVLLRLRVTGREHLPVAGPVILSPNHQSYLDAFLLVSALPFRLLRNLFFVGASEYFATPLRAWVARKINLIPIDPDTNLVRAVQAGAFGLRHGKVLVLFPEGERSIDGQVKMFKKGAAILSLHLDVPIVPVALDGVYDVWPRGRAPQRLAKVAIAFGPALAPPGKGSCTNLETAYAELTERLCSAVVRMVEGLKSRRGASAERAERPAP